MAIRESEAQRAICDYLALKGYFFWRNNNVPIFDPTRKTFRAMPKYTMKGIPDIIIIKDSKFIGLEVKSDTGKLSPEQRKFGVDCTLHGGTYALVRSIDDVQAMGL